jgi:hypothetical protein
MKAKSDKTYEDMSKSGKYDDEMSMAESDDAMSVVYIAGKAGKMQETHDVHSSVVGKYDENMSIGEEDTTTSLYMGKSGKAMKSDAKAGKAVYPLDPKSGKEAYYYYSSGKSIKGSHSMSMVEVVDSADDEMSDDQGEWVPITTDAAITTVPAEAPTETASSSIPAETTGFASTTEATGSADTPSTAVQTTIATELAASTTGFSSLKAIEELMEEGGHGVEGHIHSKSGETQEISNKIARGEHLRPDALQTSDSSALYTSRYSIVAVCLASFLALSL